MNTHAQKLLDYTSLLDLLATYASSEPGKEALRALKPRPAQPTHDSDQRLYHSFMDIRAKEITPRRAGFDSPHAALAKAAPKGSVLDVEDMLLLRQFLRQLRDVREFLHSEPIRPFKPACQLGEAMQDFAELLRVLERTFDDAGEVQDNASATLKELRQRRKRVERRISQRLENLLQDPNLADVFHDRFVAVRNQRFVVPVKRELKGKLKGVIHDQSNTGRTVFMEPQLTLEDGNELSTIKLSERDEILKILAELSNFVRGCRDKLSHAAGLLTSYDCACAISEWAEISECRYPRTAPRLQLHQARHPLLLHQFQRAGEEDKLVSLDFEIPSGTRVLAITGSNTGGKTVALKTIGLLAIMHQAGLPIPASGTSRLPWYQDILADIGDEQSLQQSLSTFSGHLRNISDILAAADKGETLVLLDELGSGTDPIEGGALGCSILDTLAATRSTIFVTTHLGMIKTHVHAHDHMLNASVRFNAETLRPEYVLEIGRPGASHALLIAARCGVPEAVLANARDMLSAEHLSMEEMLASIEEKERTIQDELDAAQSARDTAAKERTELKDELDELRDQRKKLLHQARLEAGAIVDNTRRQMETLLEKARHVGKGEEARTLRKTVKRKEATIKKGIEESAPRPPTRVKSAELEEGMRVWVAVLNDHATIVHLTGDRKRATVDVGGMSFDVKTAQLGPEKSPPEAKKNVQISTHRPRGQVHQELNLIGLRVEQALPKLERFLDDALMAGLPQVRVIHGFGTGQLRTGIHKHLDSSPAIVGYRLGLPDKDPGGGGATIIQLS